MPPKPKKKLRVGWFSFTCSEDSTIVFTELMNERWQEWKRLLDFRHARVLQRKNVLDDMDVAFVEGVISSESQAERLRAIRAKATMLVAIGSCAVTGYPSIQRNEFDEKRQHEIEPLIKRFHYLPRSHKVADIVTVDASVTGCPMKPDIFLATLESALKKFGVKA